MKRIIPVLIIILLIILLGGGLGASYVIEKYTPTKERESLSDFYGLTEGDSVAIILNREVNEAQGKLIDDHVYLDYAFIHDNLNPRFYWDGNEELLLYTLVNDLITVTPESSEYQIGTANTGYGEPIVHLIDGTPYVSLNFIADYSTFTYDTFYEPSRVTIFSTSDKVDLAIISKDTEVRHKGGIKSPILTDIQNGSGVYVLAVDEKWTKVLTMDGIPGYVKSDLLRDQHSDTIFLREDKETYTHNRMNGPVVLGWHQVANRTANNKLEGFLETAKGLNVISPTWFCLSDNDGNISDLGSNDYIALCHSKDVKVWGLVSNFEKADIDTSRVLTHTSLRKHLEEQLISAALSYRLDGINVDFESLSSEDVGDGFIQFIRELSILCKKNNLCLSVDNYVPYPHTAFYNRTEQGLFADYVIIMGYDEHYSGSDSGSVASLSWVETGVKNTLKQTPAAGVILGIPFYTRIWNLVPLTDNVTDAEDEQSVYNVSSRVYSMPNAQEAVAAAGAETKWDDACGQYYAEWKEEDITFRCWLEEKDSIGKKLDLVDSYHLSGAAFWKLGFEDASVWDAISDHLK